ncbi:MAG: radical SAM protein [Candidatus Lokiarchaeota archaeon]|nr:radical SAM protein [Candidatus Lokiarchaeota archaeon]MBD3201092.1 radical SAM protein [Candidatus Lokiarchaeota archaeon]
MKILYINPPQIRAGLDYVFKAQPLNLLSIAAAVPEHDAKLIDFKIQRISQSLLESEFNRCDLVAITSLTPQIYSALRIAELAKKKGCITILGGYHPTLDSDFVIKNNSVDYVIRGEGENTFQELIALIDGNQNGKSKKEINGISYRDKAGKIINTQARFLEPNLDNFPMPRRDLIDYEDYSLIASLETSRGCPFKCRFCCIHKMWEDPRNKLRYRTKSIKRILQEIYKIDLHNNFIFFVDDNFTINVERTKKILNAIIKSGISNQIYFSCQSRIDTLYHNPSLIDLMHKAGMKQIFLGIESVHQQSLDRMNKKNITPSMTRKVVKMLQDFGICIFGGVIIGYPGETKKMVRQNIQFIKDLELDFVQFTPITAFPGTEFFNKMVEKKRIRTRNYRKYDLFNSMMDTNELDVKELQNLVLEAYSYYYLSGGWLRLITKRYINPFGKYNWYLSKIHKVARKVIFNGLQMFKSQGISNGLISDKLKLINE